MKRTLRILALLLGLILIFSAIGCTKQTTITSEVWEGETTSEDTALKEQSSSETKSNSGTSDGGQTDPEKIDMKGYTVVSTTWSATGGAPNPTSSTYEKEMEKISQIEQKYNCKIEFFGIADSMQYYSAFCTQTLAGNKFGDIVSLPSDQGFPSAALNGYAHCIDDYFDWNSDMFADPYVNGVLMLDGKRYYLAKGQARYGSMGSGIKFNRSVFSKLNVADPHTYAKQNAWTWENFEAVCKELTRNVDGEQYYGYSGWPKFFISNGVREVVQDGNGKYKFNLNSKGGIETVEMMKRLYDAGYMTTTTGLWDKGLVGMTGSMGYVNNKNIGWVPMPIGPSAGGEYINYNGNVGLTVIPSMVKEKYLPGVAAVICDFWYKEPSDAPQESVKPENVDEYSYQLYSEHIERAQDIKYFVTYYPWIYSKIVWTDYGISKGLTPQEFFLPVEDLAQREVDNLWYLLEVLQ